MWPLPAHIDSVAAYNTVPAALDVDGAAEAHVAELGDGPAEACVNRVVASVRRHGIAAIDPRRSHDASTPRTSRRSRSAPFLRPP